VAHPVLEIIDATVMKGSVRALNGLSLTIRQGEHTAIVGPNGAGKSTLINLLTRDEYPIARAGGSPPVRIFGSERWDVFELRTRLGIVSADLQQRFVEGHSAGRITGADAVLSGFFATRGFLMYADVTADMKTRARAALERIEASHLA
jgi:iron complex transport system ATP-binding protein